MRIVPLALGDHPRIRGEHDFSDEKPIPVAGSSPHTRGAPRHREKSEDMSRIIPAYAGSTGFFAVSSDGV